MSFGAAFGPTHTPHNSKHGPFRYVCFTHLRTAVPTQESRARANPEGSYSQCLARAENRRPPPRTKLTLRFPSWPPVRRLIQRGKARFEPFSAALFPVPPLDPCKHQPVR